MKQLLLITCIICSYQAAADVCIPREFADKGVSANYEKITAEERIKLADAQKGYAELIQQVEKKKGTANQIELLNAFIDAAGMVFLLHYYVSRQDSTHKLSKKLSKEPLPVSVSNLIRANQDADSSMKAGEFTKKLFKRRVEVFKAWVSDLKDLSWLGKAKETLFFSMKKIGFASAIAMVPLGAYIWFSRIKEQQRLVELTGEQDKVMKQAMLFNLFISQQSFAELAATRAKLHPQLVCPPTT